jgi:hypothetical protein
MVRRPSRPEATMTETDRKILLRLLESFLYCRLSASGAWELKRGLCGFFVARITKIGRLLI